MLSYFENLLTTIDHSVHSLDQDTFTRLLNESEAVLRGGHKIVVSGLGKNVPVCEKFVGTMNSLGLDACYMNTNSATHGDLGLVHDGDLVIVLTKSGSTQESVYLIDLLKMRNVSIWLLTFTKNSQIEQMVGREKCVILELDDEGDLWNIVPNNSTTVNLLVLQALAIMLSQRMNITLSDFKKNHPGGHIGVQLQNV